MIQPDLPLSHRNDPETSHAAEARMVKSGRLKSNRRRVLALVCRWPGRTVREYFTLCYDNEDARAMLSWSFKIDQFEHSRRACTFAFADLLPEINRRMRDLFERDLVACKTPDGQWCENGSKKGAAARSGSVLYWPTAAGTLENAQ